jgi:hypothetical protein
MDLEKLTEFIASKNERIRTYYGTKAESVYVHFLQCIYDFTKQYQYSDEKRNSFMTIMDEALQGLIKGELIIGSTKPANDMQEYLMRELSKK